MMDDGLVKELVEKLEIGEITPKDTVEILKERDLTEKAVLKVGAWVYLLWLIPCFLPGFAKLTSLETLSIFAELPRMHFPSTVIYLSIILFIAAIPLTALGMYFNVKKGGCQAEDHTVILIKEGPYKIVRHPSNVAWSVFFVTLPISLSQNVPFTVLSVFGIVAIVAFSYYASLIEERELDLKKWGDEYREYMEEVPRWNLLKGLWNLRKK